MSQVNGYPEPLKDSLRDALQKALQDSGVEVPGSVPVTVTNEAFGTVTIHVEDAK